MLSLGHYALSDQEKAEDSVEDKITMLMEVHTLISKYTGGMNLKCPLEMDPH